MSNLRAYYTSAYDLDGYVAAESRGRAAMIPEYDYPMARAWLLVRPDPEGPWHLHASEDHHGRARTACGRNILPADDLLADLAPSCETCLRTRLWRAILAWEPDDEAE